MNTETSVFENYDTYRALARDGMSPDEANQIFAGYCGSLDLSDEYFQGEYKKLVSSAVEYAAIRARWSAMTREEKIREDDHRTNAHNKFLNAVERHAGYLRRNGKDALWFEALGQGIEPQEIDRKRKRIGDWACYIALFAALNNR